VKFHAVNILFIRMSVYAVLKMKGSRLKAIPYMGCRPKSISVSLGKYACAVLSKLRGSHHFFIFYNLLILHDYLKLRQIKHALLANYGGKTCTLLLILAKSYSLFIQDNYCKSLYMLKSHLKSNSQTIRMRVYYINRLIFDF
jgi:hypothetical protein